ncbi:RIMB2 protein, partial [Polypterus senegalus]
MDSNSEGGQSRSGSEGNVSPVKEDVYYRSVAGRRKWPLQRSMASEQRYDGYSGQDRHSSEFYDESEPDLNEEPTRIFVALFDYDPLSMSPNPDAADEELPFKEGQIIKVHGDKDTDGFYRGEISGRLGLIPCNMISEIQTDDEEMMEQLIKQGFLPLNTPVEKIERNRRSGRQHSVSTRRMVALYDYDPRESSPNVDVEDDDVVRSVQFCNKVDDVMTAYKLLFDRKKKQRQQLLITMFLQPRKKEPVPTTTTDTPSETVEEVPQEMASPSEET